MPKFGVGIITKSTKKMVILNFLLNKNPLSTENYCFQTFITIRSVSWAANQRIRMISEGSRDTELLNIQLSVTEISWWDFFQKPYNILLTFLHNSNLC